jgi:hypothetical protein
VISLLADYPQKGEIIRTIAAAENDGSAHRTIATGISGRRDGFALSKAIWQAHKTGGNMKMAKAESTEAKFKVWCESCSIRVAPNEERIVVRGKTYHSHCYSKMNSKPKVDVRGLPV